MANINSGFGTLHQITTNTIEQIVYAAVDNTNSNRIISQASNGKTFVATISEEDQISITQRNFGNLVDNPYFRLHYKFESNKSFTYALLVGTSFSQAGVSLSAEPFTKDIYDGSDLVNANLVNTVEGEAKFSLNKILATTISDIPISRRDSNGTVPFNTDCPSYFVFRGFVKQCITTCSELELTHSNEEVECAAVSYNLSCYTDGDACVDVCSNYIQISAEPSNTDSTGVCVDSCENGFELRHPEYIYFSREVKVFCTPECSFLTYENFYVNNGVKHCTDNCGNRWSKSGIPKKFAYLLEDECIEECPSDSPFVVPYSKYGSNKESGTCVNKCETPLFQLSSPEYIAQNGIRNTYCVPDCNKDAYINYFIDGSSQICVDDCRQEIATNTMIPDRRYRLEDDTRFQCVAACPDSFVLDVTEFGNNTEDGLCATSCRSNESPLEHASFVFSDNSKKIYCLPACIEPPLNKEHRHIGGIQCTDSCLTEEASVNIPNNIRYHFHQDNKTVCAAKCPPSHPFIKDVSDFNTSTEHGECVSACDSTDFVVSKPIWLYSDNSPKQYCSNSCAENDLFFFFENSTGKECVSSCVAPQAATRRYSLKSGNEVDQCVAKCPHFVANLENFNSPEEFGECLDTCDGFTFSSTEFLWSDGTPKAFCLESCSDLIDTDHFITPNNECVHNCQVAGFQFSNADNSCSNTCTDFVLNDIFCVQTCPTEFSLLEGKTCTDKCSEEKPFLLEFKECVAECPNVAYEDICVDSCTDPFIVQYLAEQGKSFSSRPFISSQRVCVESCSEEGFPMFNSKTNECITSCPPACNQTNCSFNSMRYNLNDITCVTNCQFTDFPLTDDIQMRCVDRCPPERPFLADGLCLEKCPSTRSFVIKQPTCGVPGCDSACTDFELVCSAECTSTFPLELQAEDSTFCVCECPKSHSVVSNKCMQFCDAEAGFMIDTASNNCLHCFKERNESYLHQGACVTDCPEETAANQHGVCVPCLRLGLWTNERKQCVPFSRCDPMSHFNFPQQICTKCAGNGYMIIKRNSILTCEKTDCKNGHFSKVAELKMCTECAQAEFFEDPDCTITCSPGKIYDFTSRKCLTCSSKCSCCIHGECTANRCKCENGWTGLNCTVLVEQVDQTVAEIFAILEPKTDFYQDSDNQLLLELSLLVKHQRRVLQTSSIRIEALLNNVFSLLKHQRILNAFQPRMLHTLDSLLQLAISFSQITQQTDYLNSLIDFLYETTNAIQVFNTTSNVDPEFVKVVQAKLEGESFDLSFGIDVSTESRVDLTVCLLKLKKNLSLVAGHKFAYRLLALKGELTTIKPERGTFVASNKPTVVMISLYNSKGRIDFQTTCAQRFVDLTFTVEIEDKVLIDSINKLKAQKVNAFDNQDPFFNNRCVPFSEGNDITLSKRKETMFVNPSEICNESKYHVCLVEKTDSEGKTECNCKGIKETKKSAIESTFSTYPKTNYVLVTCSKVFKNAILSKNKGFFTVVIPCILAILLMYWYKWKVDEDLSDERRFQYMRTDIEVFNPSQMNKETYFSECAELESRLNIIVFESQTLEKSSSKKIDFDFNSLPTLPDLSLLSFEDSLRLDPRSHFQFCKDAFLLENSLYYALFSKSALDPKPFVLLLFVTELNLNVTLNCFFIDDDLVDSFGAKENNSLISSISSELPKTIWALITAKLLTLLLYMFYTFDEKQARLLKKRLVMTTGNSAVKAYNLFLQENTCRFTMLSVVIAVFNLFCIYFVVIYNEIYIKSTDIWLNGIIMGLVMDTLVIQGILPLMFVVSRAVAKRFPHLSLFYKGMSQLNTLKKLLLP